VRQENVIFCIAGDNAGLGRKALGGQSLTRLAGCDLGQADVITGHGWGVGAGLRVDLRRPHSAARLTLS
jgi:hypothetical protein